MQKPHGLKILFPWAETHQKPCTQHTFIIFHALAPLPIIFLSFFDVFRRFPAFLGKTLSFWTLAGQWLSFKGVCGSSLL
jgi:hypothetical protein